MKDRFARLSVALPLLMAPIVVSAQFCNDDIPATTPDSRFMDNGDGTVSDAATGLIWKKCPEGLVGAGCTTGTAAEFTWQEALQVAADTDFAGHTDWRLPNINELASLHEERCSRPAINATYFPNTPSSAFLSSSPTPAFANGVWIVVFEHGAIAHLPQVFAQYVRLVRAGQ